MGITSAIERSAWRAPQYGPRGKGPLEAVGGGVSELGAMLLGSSGELGTLSRCELLGLGLVGGVTAVGGSDESGTDAAKEEEGRSCGDEDPSYDSSAES